MAGSKPQEWERQLLQQGTVEIGLSPAKRVVTVIAGVLFVLVGLLLIIIPLMAEGMDLAPRIVLPVTGALLLLLAPLGFSQLTGVWNIVVTWQDIGYRNALVPWSEVEVIGEITQRVRGAQQDHGVIVFTPRGHDMLVSQMGGIGAWLQNLNAKLLKVPALSPAKLLDGSQAEKIGWLASVHMRILEAQRPARHPNPYSAQHPDQQPPPPGPVPPQPF